ncbi:hypothetical protein BD770DRAFT_407085 [Pilaira anomala]|nr:hypothetical protein BD770DRAFT_407085 [Pilaira anomala]
MDCLYLILKSNLLRETKKRKKDTPEELQAKQRSRQSRDQEVAESSKSAQTRVIRGYIVFLVIFSQNFWYSVCMLIFGNLSSQELQVKYSSVPNIGNAFDQYFQDYSLSMRPLSGLKEYSQCLSSACITLETTYNNYYVENF